MAKGNIMVLIPTSVPSSADPLAGAESHASFPDLDNISNYLVARNAREYMAESSVPYDFVGVANAAREDFDE